MLEKAYKENENDPYIIDSVGWGYFLIGKYNDAEKYMRRAIELMPNDPIVNDHYGDILWRLNRKIQAKYFWRNTIKLDDVDEKLIKNISIFSLKSSNQEKKKINSLEFSAKFNLSKKWSAGIKVIDDLEQEKSINSVISFDYENDGLIVGLTYINSRELDWVSILENSTFRDYHNDRFRLYFELKGLGSLGRPKEDYLKRRSL